VRNVVQQRSLAQRGLTLAAIISILAAANRVINLEDLEIILGELCSERVVYQTVDGKFCWRQGSINV